jgi:hypothetical protein
VVGVNSYQVGFDPVPGDDITNGYIIGDQWINTVSDEIFVCVDNTAAAAVWKSITDSSGSIPVASNTFVFTAAENIPAYAPVTTSGLIPSSSNISHAPLIAGIAIAATNSGNSGNYQFAGVIANASWSLSVGPVYLNGSSISNTPPASGIVKIIGRAISATRIIVDVDIDYYIVESIDLNIGNSRSVSITHNMRKNPGSYHKRSLRV